MALWLQNGTVAITQGQTVVVGTGTTFKTALNPAQTGQPIIIRTASGLDMYEIESVQDDTHLTLAAPVLAATAGSLQYIIPVTIQGSFAALANRAALVMSELNGLVKADQNLSELTQPDVALGHLGLSAFAIELIKQANADQARAKIGAANQSDVVTLNTAQSISAVKSFKFGTAYAGDPAAFGYTWSAQFNSEAPFWGGTNVNPRGSFVPFFGGASAAEGNGFLTHIKLGLLTTGAEGGLQSGAILVGGHEAATQNKTADYLFGPDGSANFPSLIIRKQLDNRSSAVQVGWIQDYYTPKDNPVIRGFLHKTGVGDFVIDDQGGGTGKVNIYYQQANGSTINSNLAADNDKQAVLNIGSKHINFTTDGQSSALYNSGWDLQDAIKFHSGSYNQQASVNAPFWAGISTVPSNTFCPISGGAVINQGQGYTTHIKIGVVTSPSADWGQGCLLVGAHEGDGTGSRNYPYMFNIDGTASFGALMLNAAQSGDARAATRKDYVDGKVSSDARLKTNYDIFVNPLDMVNQLKGKLFDKQMWPLETVERRAGVIAQEVEGVFPEAVGWAGDDENGVKTVDPLALCGLLIEAIKALGKEVEDLKTKLKIA